MAVSHLFIPFVMKLLSFTILTLKTFASLVRFQLMTLLRVKVNESIDFEVCAVLRVFPENHKERNIKFNFVFGGNPKAVPQHGGGGHSSYPPPNN